MGGGFHGGFGNTAGVTERYRVGKPVEATPKSLEMALNPVRYIEIICKKYNIHLRGSGIKISVRFNSDMPLAQMGKTRADAPNIIEVGPGALISEKELANTIAHELNHARSYLRGGSAPERTAYPAGDALQSYIEGER